MSISIQQWLINLDECLLSVYKSSHRQSFFIFVIHKLFETVQKLSLNFWTNNFKRLTTSFWWKCCLSKSSLSRSASTGWRSTRLKRPVARLILAFLGVGPVQELKCTAMTTNLSAEDSTAEKVCSWSYIISLNWFDKNNLIRWVFSLKARATRRDATAKVVAAAEATKPRQCERLLLHWPYSRNIQEISSIACL